VIIDDLGHLRSTDQVVGCSVDDARHIVTALTKHHAQWWNSERLATLPYIQSAGAPPRPQFNDRSFKQSWPVIVERFGDLVPERIAKICEHWSDLGPVMMEYSVNHPVTLCHGDLRLDNIFFNEGGDSPITVVD
jgi:aminoglycoside phosphotransferase family enzyme